MLGPMVYLLLTGVSDTRMAVFVVLLIIVAGTILLRWIDPDKGHAAAAEEDRRTYAQP